MYGLAGSYLGEEPDGAQVIIGVEAGRGPRVAALAVAGCLVFAVNLLRAARFGERHGVPGAKSGAGDARALAGMVRAGSCQVRAAAGDSPEAGGVMKLQVRDCFGTTSAAQKGSGAPYRPADGNLR